MKKQVIYKYLGTNGTIESPVHLEDIYYVRLMRLTADTGNILTNGDRTSYSVTISEDEVDQWSEIADQGQE
jgi:hypothetical protein